MGFKLVVNDEVVWESDGPHVLVTEASISTIRGEAAKVNVANDIDALYINLAIRDAVDNNEPLDIQELRASDLRRDALEADGATKVDAARELVTNDEKRRLMFSGDFARDEDGNPVKNEKGTVKKLANVSDLAKEIHVPHAAGTAGVMVDSEEDTSEDKKSEGFSLSGADK